VSIKVFNASLERLQSGRSSLNLDGSSDGLRFRLSGHFGCTITGVCFEELRNRDNDDTSSIRIKGRIRARERNIRWDVLRSRL
jgi:hypothetical protein